MSVVILVLFIAACLCLLGAAFVPAPETAPRRILLFPLGVALWAIAALLMFISGVSRFT